MEPPYAVVVATTQSGEQIVGSGMTLPTGTLRSDPQLGPLQDNGGLTHTQALMPGSPAIDAGNNTAQGLFTRPALDGILARCRCCGDRYP